jgi:hypothetical protein
MTTNQVPGENPQKTYYTNHPINKSNTQKLRRHLLVEGEITYMQV